MDRLIISNTYFTLGVSKNDNNKKIINKSTEKHKKKEKKLRVI